MARCKGRVPVALLCRRTIVVSVRGGGVRGCLARETAMLWWWLRQLRSPRPARRARAAERLGKRGDPRTVEPLAAALKDDETVVRGAAAEALGLIGDERVIAPLVEALQDRDSYVRAVVAVALGRVGDARAAAPLAALLADTDEFVGYTVVHALGQIDDPKAAEHLVGALGCERASIRGAAAAELGNSGWHPPDATQRARYAIARGRYREAVQEGRAAAGPLVAVLADRNERVCEAAAEALAELGEAAVAPLVDALEDSRRRVRMAAAGALVRLGGVAVGRLLILLQKDDPRLRRTAVWALGRIGAPRALGAMLAVLTEGDPDLRGPARVALVDLAKAAIERGGLAEAVELMSTAAETTLAVVPPFVQEVLRVCKRDHEHNPERTMAVCDAVTEDVKDSLLFAFETDDEDVRREAYAALATIYEMQIHSRVSMAAYTQALQFAQDERDWSEGLVSSGIVIGAERALGQALVNAAARARKGHAIDRAYEFYVAAADLLYRFCEGRLAAAAPGQPAGRDRALVDSAVRTLNEAVRGQAEMLTIQGRQRERAHLLGRHRAFKKQL